MSGPVRANEARARVARRAVVAAAIGNLLEWYNFTVFALFALYIGDQLFVSDNPTVQLAKAFLVFGVGFVARPLGAVLFGIYGDRIGRKAALTLTILIMAAGSALIAIAPTHAQIGSAAALVLVAGRLLQGLSAGGELGSGVVFMVEHAPEGRKGLYTAWILATIGLSNTLGATTALTLSLSLSQGQMAQWGWRIPFVIGLLIVPVGLYLRRVLPETPEFLGEAARRRRSPRRLQPLALVFREHARSLIIGLGLAGLSSVAVYVLLIYAPVLVQKTFHFTASQAFVGSLAGNGVFVVSCFLFGRRSDSVGARRVLAYGAALLLFAVPPLFYCLESWRSTGAVVFVLAAFGVLVASYSSVVPSVVAALFPTSVRAIGVSLVFNAASTVLGGFAPAILTWLTRSGSGSVYAPAVYVTLVALPAFAAIGFLPGRRFEAQAANS